MMTSIVNVHIDPGIEIEHLNQITKRNQQMLNDIEEWHTIRDILSNLGSYTRDGEKEIGKRLFERMLVLDAATWPYRVKL